MSGLDTSAEIDPLKRIDSFVNKKMEAFNRMHELAFEYMGQQMDLANAYIEDGFDRLDEKLFGKLELIPDNCKGTFIKSKLRMTQWEIKSQVGMYFLRHNVGSWIMETNHLKLGDPALTRESQDMEKELDTELQRIIKIDKLNETPEILSDVRWRWGYATAALAIFDEAKTIKGNTDEYRLEMRKMILDGVRKDPKDTVPPRIQEMSTKIAKATQRDQLSNLLNEYING